ncbi:nucleotidyl transferase AbiEii/AbiGii toxin family protein [Leucobacter sp. M11]|uniref:nucleotidyl transferase AbiEii/AbiGii toxin family protein n=1 Tax=Leucobacter sp. M11 TaxID=2993565 RepID=UPI002D7F9062|nr:nucleotidyl transferase AbiEii/AbiGii toxin family protein [Leucobacter sp. M11]MEB4614659.1 nucleotidyl transferase AbiEii/AbiGii toxin family protein [Leucobacter sp. M11]
MLCTLVVSQLLPDAVVIKGGMGIKLRLGERGTRATSDLDVSTTARGEAFSRDLAVRLARGWGSVPASRGARRRDPGAPERVAFTATVRAGKAHDPGLGRPEYVMHPYRVSIAFLGRPWGALDLEVSDPEADAGSSGPFQTIDAGLLRFAETFGFGELGPVRLVSLESQIAQKIHAVTDPATERAHDLVDLQVLWAASPDLPSLRQRCVRTFAWRRQQPWPPLPLRPMHDWALAYRDAREETVTSGHSAVLAEIADARSWLTNLIGAIDAAEEPPASSTEPPLGRRPSGPSGPLGR